MNWNMKVDGTEQHYFVCNAFEWRTGTNLQEILVPVLSGVPKYIKNVEVVVLLVNAPEDAIYPISNFLPQGMDATVIGKVVVNPSKE